MQQQLSKPIGLFLGALAFFWGVFLIVSLTKKLIKFLSLKRHAVSSQTLVLAQKAAIDNERGLPQNRQRAPSAERMTHDNGRAFSYNRREAPSPEQYESKKLMTNNEIEFFLRLTRALPDYYIFPQVALNALLKTKGYVPPKVFHSLRNKFVQKVADYVLCDRNTFEVVAIIELDDRTHNHKQEKDGKRDAMLHAAGYRTIRFPSKKKPSEQEIADLFRRKDETN